MRECGALQIKGRVRLTATDPKTGEVRAIMGSPNTVVMAGKALIARMLIDVSGWDTGLTYCAVGTGSTAVDEDDTDLVTESARNTITLKERATNVMYLQTFFDSGDVNANLQEMGLFGHSTASGAADSGEMFARALLNYDNSGGSPSDITIEWEVTIG